MPLHETTRQDLDRHLADLGLARGTDVLVHSRLISFGHIAGGPETVLGALRDAVGPGATIAVPTYTLELADDVAFDRARTPSQGMGVFAEHVRRLPGARRSRCPLHSHAAVGPGAALLDGTTGEISLGPGSDFEAFFEAGFSMLFLGCRIRDAATYTMHAETLAEVPYRRWMALPRRVVGDDGAVRPFTCRYFGRGRPGGDLDLAGVEAAMIEAGIVASARSAYGVSHLVAIADYHPRIMDMLRDDPLTAMPKEEPADG